jgi:hypothetical protein
MRCLLAFVIGLAIASSSLAGTVRDDRSDSLYLNLGSLYPSVGQILGADATSSFAASAVLVSQDWALTAAHVTSGATSLSFNVGGNNYAGSGWVTNPNWTGSLSNGYDLGLIHLNSSVTNVAPALRYTGSSENGKTATYVGYGTTGTGLTGWQNVSSFSQLEKRGEQNVIDYLPNARILESDFDNPATKFQKRDNSMGSRTPLDLEGLIAPGDSGGGVFINVSGVNYLAGINSFLSAWDGKVNADYGDISGAIRVSAFNSWIDSVINGPAPTNLATSLAADANAVAFTTGSTVPEPATSVLFLIAAIAGLIRRRR